MEIKKFSIFIIVTMILAMDTSASEIIEVDWNNGVDFNAFATRHFHLNDMLVFKYEVGKHNMLIVNDKFYDSCFVCPIATPHSTGDDHILLDKPGKWYFIDGIENGKNCKENNVKLVIEVTDKPLKTSMKTEYDPPEVKRYIQVGDEVGWNPRVDFKAWAERVFELNDMLIFNYEVGKHNMLIVDEGSYNKCFVCPIAKPHNTGNDSILLDRAGKWYFIDAIENGKYCKENDMKLAIEVTDKPLKTSMKVEYDFPEAKRYIQVGDEVGWNPSVDFKAWAERVFELNDMLIFKYEVGKHNMLIVDEGSYNKCFVCPIAKPHDTGDDHILLDRAGKWYFIDATENGKYCKENDMKLAIDVADPKKDSGVQGGRKLVQQL